MAAVTMLLGLFVTVSSSLSVLQAFQDEENVSELSDKQFRNMESKFEDLLAKAKTEMDNKYNSLLNDHVAQRKRLGNVENDNMALKERIDKIETENVVLKDSVSSLYKDNHEWKYRFIKLHNDSIRAMHGCVEAHERGRPYAGEENDHDSNRISASQSTFDIQQQGDRNSNNNRMDSPEKRLILPVTATPSSVPVPTQPRVAFYARLSEHLTNVSDNQHIMFNDVVTNVGNAYLKATSTFICPFAGTYVFTWTILSCPGKFIDTAIALNGHYVGLTYSYNDNHYNSASNVVVLDLQEHDAVWVSVHEGYHHDGAIADSVYSTFSGYILWSN